MDIKEQYRERYVEYKILQYYLIYLKVLQYTVL